MVEEGTRRCQELALSHPRHDAAAVLLAARRSLSREKYVLSYANIVSTEYFDANILENIKNNPNKLRAARF
jgi:hypothetical protein